MTTGFSYVELGALSLEMNKTMGLYAFEENFSYRPIMKWMLKHWCQAFWYSAIYVVLIFGGRYYMRDRPRFELRGPLALWSAILAVFSFCGAARTVPELVYVLRKFGWEFSVCSTSYAYYNPTSFWTFMFTISKVYELGDTIFIVLRKQPLIFLHWYHHIVTMIYVWYSYTGHTSTGRWFIAMNFSIHAFMYTYYTLKALRFHIPRGVSMVITTAQILQMVVGTVVIISAWRFKNSGRFCSASYTNLKFSCLMYFSYIVLFVHFFYKVYINKARAAAAAKEHGKGDAANAPAQTYLKPLNGVNGVVMNGYHHHHHNNHFHSNGNMMNGVSSSHLPATDKKHQ